MKHRKNTPAYTVGPSGEIIRTRTGETIHSRFKSDTPVEHAAIPYIIMALCLVIDGCIFYGLFRMLSYDSFFLKVVSMGGLLLGMDIIPIFAGIYLRRIRQHLTRDRFLLYIALGVAALAAATNIGLRILTIDQLTPDNTDSGYSYLSDGQEEQEIDNAEIDPAILASTIFACIVPIITSCGSFVISYATYDPLRIRSRREEEGILSVTEEKRQAEAILAEYDATSNFEEALKSDDEQKYKDMLLLHRALAVSYCGYVRQSLIEHLGSATSTNALSRETGDAILKRLDAELQAFLRETSSIPDEHGSDGESHAAEEGPADTILADLGVSGQPSAVVSFY